MKTILAFALALTALPATAFAQALELESIDVAIRDASSGERVYLRGYRDGRTEHKFYTPQDGYTAWTTVPNPGAVECVDDDLDSVEAFAFRDGSLLYIRAFEESGLVEQNVFTPADGWSGWNALPHEDEKDGEQDPIGPDGEEPGDLESVDVEIMGSSLTSPRIFIRGFEEGLFEQCVYTPGDGFMGWTEIPGMKNLMDVADTVGDDVESVQVTPMGGLTDPRVFVAGFRDSGRLYQNIYTPGKGYTGWKRVRNQTQALGNSQISSADVQYLGNGVILYVRGRLDGNVQQNFFTPADGFLGWNRVTRRDNPWEMDLESCSVELFEPGVNGRRIYVRALEGGDSGFGNGGKAEQCFYDPETGTTRWEEIP